MKKSGRLCAFVLIGLIFALTTQAEELQAEQIYTECEQHLNHVENNQVLQGNISDVQNERLLRKCLKDKIKEIAGQYLQDEYADDFSASLDAYENSATKISKYFFFCAKDVSGFWCKQRANDDLSLDKLLMEKQVTSDIYGVLQNLLVTIQQAKPSS